jgi:hypothetical protein
MASGSGAYQPPPSSDVLYGGVNGSFSYGGAARPGASASFGGRNHSFTFPAEDGVMAPGGAHAAPKFYKLEFPTYDGEVDPLNWLNRCEQFFHGQCTLTSDHTWLASYHLRGTTQTWYPTLEQDEGMPAWEHFRELC